MQWHKASFFTCHCSLVHFRTVLLFSPGEVCLHVEPRVVDTSCLKVAQVQHRSSDVATIAELAKQLYVTVRQET
jgi:hypothetical protein